MIAFYKSPGESCRMCKQMFRSLPCGALLQIENHCTDCYLKREYLRQQHNWRQQFCADVDAINAEREQMRDERIGLRDIGF